MDEQQTTNQTSGDDSTVSTETGGQILPAGGQVMDVTAPNKQPETSSWQETSTDTPEGDVPDTQFEPGDSPAAAPASPEPTESLISEPKLAEPAAEAPTPAPEAHSPANTPHLPAKNGAPVAAIVIAAVVATALAGLVIFSYFKAKNSDTVKRSDAASSQTVVEKPQASTADVDTTNQEIDTSLQQANDSTDFAAAELSDTALGL